MSFQGLTPESLLNRSDSKDPATTCKGLTSSGRPCRRGLGSTPGSSPSVTPTKRSGKLPSRQDDSDNAGVVAIIDSNNAAAFFCWQHKDQAQNLVAQVERLQGQQQNQQQHRTRIVPLQKRSSIDTLIEKVGIIELDDDVEGDELRRNRLSPQGRASRGRKPGRRETLPVEWQRIQGPLMSVPEEVIGELSPERRVARRRSQSRPRVSPRQSWQQRPQKHQRPEPKPGAKTRWSCCTSVEDGYNDDGPPVRRRERHQQRRASGTVPRTRMNGDGGRPPLHGSGVVSSVVPQMQSQVRPQMQQWSQQHVRDQVPRLDPRGERRQHRHQPNRNSDPSSTITPNRSRPTATPTQLNTSTPPHSQTSHFLSLIPPHLDPTTTSTLLAELSKPFAKDDDSGYIYIYWLTPSSTPTNPDNDNEDRPDDDIASTILDSDSEDTEYHPRSSSKSTHSHTMANRRAAALQRYASTKRKSLPTNTVAPKILLKIGRATNVHRRMTQWSKQCGQNISLVRYYPYTSQSSAAITTAMSSPLGPARKVPHVNKVERLIHIELRGMGLGKQAAGERCEVCGRGHREWFEVEGTRDGLKGIDGVVRRWVGWAEKLPPEA